MNDLPEYTRWETYSKEFYDSGANRRSYDSARVILPRIVEVCQPSSILDYGCGRGTWLAVALELGVGVAVGYEGPWVKEEMLVHAGIELRTQDGEKEIHIEGQFDLAICLEVVEHLSPDASDRLVGELISASHTVLFSGAIPYQGGDGHINERPQADWVRVFQSHGFQCLDIIRPRHWDDPAVGPAYKQNSFLFTSDEAMYRELRLSANARVPYNLVHPEFFQFHRRAQLDTTGKGLRALLRRLLENLTLSGQV